MPAVVRGGRRQSSGSARPAKAPARRGRGPRPASGVPGKLAAIGRLEISPRGVALAIAAGAVTLALVLAGGSRADDAARGLGDAYGRATAGMGLKLKRVRIEGASDAVKPQIAAALDLEKDQPLATLDLEAVRGRVRQVGWVREARVVRLYPDLLLVQVAEHDRLAVWRDGDRTWVIDGQGAPIRGADPAAHAELPLIVGAGAGPAAAPVLRLISERPRLAGRLDALVRVDQRRWDLRLKDGSLIRLPADDEEAALIAFDQLDASRRLLDLGFEVVDLRRPGAVAIRGRGAEGTTA